MKKVLVRGPVLTRSGYGEHVRFILRSLKKLEDKIDLYIIPLGWGHTGWVVDKDDEREWLDRLIQKTTMAINQSKHANQPFSVDISIQVSIPNEWEKLAPINIGVTAGIETTKVAPSWLEKGNLMDLIIVPSEHSKQSYKNTSYSVTVEQTGQVIDDFKCATPIKVISYPVKEHNKVDLDLKLDTDFNFLSIAQWGPRKNIVNSIQWFVEEFIDQEVGLVLKTNFTKNSLVDRRKIYGVLKSVLSKEDYRNRKCKIYLLHGDMTDQEIHSLYKHPKIKALLTTTHGEGFGLPIFEAAYQGLPVIAPGWSGQNDFLHMPTKDKKGKQKNKAMFAKVDYTLQPVQQSAIWDGVIQKDSMWCYAEQGSYKIKLREVYKDHGRFNKQATQLQKYLQKKLSKDNQYQLVHDIVESFLPSEEEQEWLEKLDEIEVL
jgi:glycosyltransferase involved in cell wall biosynthesis